MCNHVNKDNAIMFEIRQEQGQEPRYICKLCNEDFSQKEVSTEIQKVDDVRLI